MEPVEEEEETDEKPIKLVLSHDKDTSEPENCVSISSATGDDNTSVVQSLICMHHTALPLACLLLSFHPAPHDAICLLFFLNPLTRRRRTSCFCAQSP